jgi:hypothetical protein
LPGSVFLAPRARFRRTRFDAPKSASQPDNPKTGSSYRPFAPPHGLPVSGSPRRNLHSRPGISPATARQTTDSFGHPLPASTVSGLGADRRRIPVACAERTASRLSLHRRSPPGLSSLGILAFRPCGPLGSHGRTVKTLTRTLTDRNRPIFLHSPSACNGNALSDHRSGIATALPASPFRVPLGTFHILHRMRHLRQGKNRILRYVSTVFYLTYFHSDTMTSQ